jgi:hypothetical protein
MGDDCFGLHLAHETEAREFGSTDWTPRAEAM